MEKYIILSFVINQKQKWEDIKKSIEKYIPQCLDNQANLIHSFKTRRESSEKEFSEEVITFFDKHFENIIAARNYKDSTADEKNIQKVYGEKMVELALNYNAEVYVFGEISGEVKEEVDLYIENEIPIRQFPL